MGFVAIPPFDPASSIITEILFGELKLILFSVGFFVYCYLTNALVEMDQIDSINVIRKLREILNAVVEGYSCLVD